MNVPAPLSAAPGEKEAALASVALLYYGEGLTQGDIARRLRVSRATIVNMLREARERGVVEIRVDGRALAGSNLGRALRERFGLQDVYVARAGAPLPAGRGRDAPQAAQLRAAQAQGVQARHFAQVAAGAFLDVLEPGDRVGVEWGRTVHAMARELPRRAVAGVEVCQMVGSMVSTRLPASETCAILIANALSARCYTLHAPALVASASLARNFLSEPTIRAQLERLQHLDMVVTSIGPLTPDTHLVAAGMATPAMLEVARAHGACGVLCCRYIRSDGRACPLPPDERLIGVSLETLKRARKRLLMAQGAERAEAVRATLRGGLVSHLCLDQPLAEALLAGEDEALR